MKYFMTKSVMMHFVTALGLIAGNNHASRAGSREIDQLAKCSLVLASTSMIHRGINVPINLGAISGSVATSVTEIAPAYQFRQLCNCHQKPCATVTRSSGYNCHQKFWMQLSPEAMQLSPEAPRSSGCNCHQKPCAIVTRSTVAVLKCFMTPLSIMKCFSHGSR